MTTKTWSDGRRCVRASRIEAARVLDVPIGRLEPIEGTFQPGKIYRRVKRDLELPALDWKLAKQIREDVASLRSRLEADPRRDESIAVWVGFTARLLTQLERATDALAGAAETWQED